VCVCVCLCVFFFIYIYIYLEIKTVVGSYTYMEQIRIISRHFINLFWNHDTRANNLTLVQRGIFRCFFVMFALIGLGFVHDQSHKYENLVVHYIINILFALLWFVAFYLVSLTSMELEKLTEIKEKEK